MAFYKARAKLTLLLPVRRWFIWLSLALALALSLLPLGRVPWWPDLLSVVLVFWAVQQPERIGLTVAFVLGLLMDVQEGSMLGQHALAYALQVAMAVLLSRRILWGGVWVQALYVLPLFLIGHLALLLTGLAGGGVLPGWALAYAPLIETALWPLATWMLLAPQRRPPDQDDNRPL